MIVSIVSVPPKGGNSVKMGERGRGKGNSQYWMLSMMDGTVLDAVDEDDGCRNDVEVVREMDSPGHRKRLII